MWKPKASLRSLGIFREVQFSGSPLLPHPHRVPLFCTATFQMSKQTPKPILSGTTELKMGREGRQGSLNPVWLQPNVRHLCSTGSSSQHHGSPSLPAGLQTTACHPRTPLPSSPISYFPIITSLPNVPPEFKTTSISLRTQVVLLCF